MTTRRALIWCYDVAGVRVGAIGHDILELAVDTTLDTAEQLELSVPADHPKADLLAADVELEHEGRRYFITEREYDRAGPATTLNIEADALWYRLAESWYVGSLVLDAATPAAGITTILAGTGWSVDAVATTSADTFSMEAQDKSRLEMLRIWARVTGLNLRFDTRAKTVRLVAAAGRTTGFSFRYGRNVTGVRKRIRPPRITRLYPFGADDLGVAGVNSGVPYIQDLSYYTDQGLTEDEVIALDLVKSRPYVDTAITVDTELLAAANIELAKVSAPTIEYELSVVDLTELHANEFVTTAAGVTLVERVAAGDTVRVYDPTITDDLTATCTRVRRYPLEPWRNTIELSTSPTIIANTTTGSSRISSADEWRQFVGPIRATYNVRLDGDYNVARIPLRFRDGGRADFHLDLWATGVGAGDLVVTVIDLEDGDAVQFKTITVPYTDGNTVRATMSWAVENLSGSHNYAVNVTTVADGGASSSNGVDIDPDTGYDLIETDGVYEASFWIKAQGAVQETPTAANSVRFDYVSDAVQTWTVPDNVETVTVTAAAAGGGQSDPDTSPGSGARYTFTMPVVPGTVYDVYAPAKGGTGGSSGGVGGWPGGGDGGATAANSDGGGGGGYAALIPTGAGLADAIVVAGAGGGNGDQGSSDGLAGGNGGCLNGYDGGSMPGSGATTTAGGIGDPAVTYSDGTFGQGGTGDQGNDPFAEGGGGGGGGWYGGGAGQSTGAKGFGGGGGSGYLNLAVAPYNILIEDGVNSGNGYLEMSWETPA